MKCENLQFNLPVYLDDILTAEERASVDEHLAQCPLCRQKSAEYQALRNGLRVMARPEMPSDLLASVRNRVALGTGAIEQKSASVFTEDFRRWMLMRFMPYSVGTVVSVVLTFGLLWVLLLNPNKIGQNNEIARLQPLNKSTVLLANPKANSGDYESSAPDFDVPRLAISGESPSVNPQGALIALTKSFVRGKMKDDEVVVVAEVFGNGLARIDEVVEPSRNRRAVRELENALKSDDPNYAPPFVPAHLDQRSDTVRVVFKIQSVNINTHLKPERK